MKTYIVGSVINGIVTGIEDYGIFVSLDNGTTGLIHISEISESFVKNVDDYAKIGDAISAKVLEYDEISDKLKLSIKQLSNNHEVSNDHELFETENGFNGLRDSLNYWVNEKKQEICKNQKKSQ